MNESNINSPGAFANRLGIVPRRKKGRGLSTSMLTLDQVLDLAVAAYWQNRPSTENAA